MEFDNQNEHRESDIASGRFDNLKPENTPLVVDVVDCTRRPITDRDIVVEMIRVLSNSTFEALAKDLANNKRYARKLVINNKIRNESTKRKQFERQLTEIPLPVNFVCWNDLQIDEIELEMCRTIADMGDAQVWWRTKVVLSSFIDQTTKDMVDEELSNMDDLPEVSQKRARRAKRQKLLRAALEKQQLSPSMPTIAPERVTMERAEEVTPQYQQQAPQDIPMFENPQASTILPTFAPNSPDLGTLPTTTQQVVTNVATSSDDGYFIPPSNDGYFMPPSNDWYVMTPLDPVPPPVKQKKTCNKKKKNIQKDTEPNRPRGRPRKVQVIECDGNNIQMVNQQGLKPTKKRRKKMQTIEDDGDIEIVYENFTTLRGNQRLES